jgi:hypothetical protein
MLLKIIWLEYRFDISPLHIERSSMSLNMA